MIGHTASWYIAVIPLSIGAVGVAPGTVACVLVTGIRIWIATEILSQRQILVWQNLGREDRKKMTQNDAERKSLHSSTI